MMRWRWTRLFLTTIFLPAAVAAQAPTGRVRGVVVDAASGEPMSAVRVRLVEHHLEELTHEDGGFAFGGLAAGRYTVTVQRIGYRPATVTVQVVVNDTADVRVRLTSTALQLAPTVVTGTLRERAGDDVLSPTSVLSGAQLDSRLGETVAATLKHEPGVAVTSLSPATARPVIRGLGGDRILVLEDGARPGDFSSISADHAVAIDALTAKQIEVVRGPMSLLYGSSALGGVVNVVREEIPTSLPEHLHGAVSAQGASVYRGGTVGGVALTALGPLALRLEGSGRAAGDVATPDGRLVNTDSRSYSGGIGLARAAASGHGGLAYRFWRNEYGIPGGFVGGHPQGVDIDTRRHSVRGEVERHWDAGLFRQLKAQAAFSDNRLAELETSGAIGTLFRQRMVTLDGAAHHDALGPFRLGAAGVRAQYRTIRTAGSLRSPSTYDLNASLFVVEEAGTERTRVQAGGRYDWARYAPRDSGVINVGGQQIPIRPRTFGSVSASLGLLHAIAPGIGLGVSVARAYRTPDFNELYSDGPHLAANSYDVGDPALAPEYGYGADVFLRVRRPTLQGQVAVFVNHLADYIFPSSRGRVDIGPQGGRPRFQYTNEDARFLGAEGSVSLALRPQLLVEGSISHVVARFTSPRDSIPVVTSSDTTFVAASLYPPLIPPLNGRVAVRWEQPAWFVEAGMRAAAPQERLGDFETRTPGYVLADVSLGVRVTAGSRLHAFTLSVDNVANRRYRDHLSRVKDLMPEPGRNVSLLYRLTF